MNGLLRLLLGAACILPAFSQTVFRLPTENDALFRNDPEGFFMYVDRNFEGVKSKPWQGGSYGFTRTIVRTPAGGPVATHFHEGIDIKPVKRDAQGEPLDIVRPVAAGTVVHASSNPRDSNYGRYVVIEHRLPEGSIYSLYAHLADVTCKAGDAVGTGNTIGILGHSGVGLNRERSHLHLEFALLLNSNFQNYYDSLKLATPNKHGRYNGMNLAGFDPVPVLQACRNGQPLDLKKLFASMEEQYRVRIPWTGTPDLLKRYPFLWHNPNGVRPPASIDISFTGGGVPIRVEPRPETVDKPSVVKALSHPFSQLYRTVNRVQGSSKEPVLTASGQRYIRLLTQQ